MFPAKEDVCIEEMTSQKNTIICTDARKQLAYLLKNLTRTFNLFQNINRYFSLKTLLIFSFSSNMATLRNKRELTAINRDNHEDHPRNNQARYTISLRIQEGYITQVLKEIESKVTKKLSQELSRTESRVLGTLSRLDEFLLNPQARVHPGSVPETDIPEIK